MCTVRAAALLGRLVDLDVLDDQVAGVQALGVGVGFGVLEEREEEGGGFLGPAGAGDAELFACVRGFVSYSGLSPNSVHVGVTVCSPAVNSLEKIPRKTADSCPFISFQPDQPLNSRFWDWRYAYPDSPFLYPQRTASWARPPSSQSHCRGRSARVAASSR